MEEVPQKPKCPRGGTLDHLPEAKRDLMDVYHPEKTTCFLPVTNAEKKPDILDVLRPGPNKYLDYSISQTDCKLDAGLTKIHIQETTAVYIPFPPGEVHVPPPKKEFLYCTGRGPLWDFEEEKWARRQDILQKRYLIEGIQRRKRKRLAEKRAAAAVHGEIMKRVGPDWFQELSPVQLTAVDNLKFCMLKDLRDCTVDNTKDIINELGLVEGPTSRQLAKALIECCQCPVEFLLILYQLINPDRTKYSLNDRLLLSAVVHLTITATLKEMHVRIPSPPPQLQTCCDKPRPPKKQKRYKSPYLVPFTYKPEPRKQTGIYKNRHIQYPESPYFSYLSEMKHEIFDEFEDDDDDDYDNLDDYNTTGEKALGSRKSKSSNKSDSGYIDPKERELIRETKAAQNIYNSMTEYRPLLRLNKPTLYIPCDFGGKLLENQEEDVLSIGSDNKTNISLAVEVKILTDYENSKAVAQRCVCRIIYDEENVSNFPTYGGISDIPAIPSNFKAGKPTRSQKKVINSKHIYIIGGVTFGACGEAIYTILGVAPQYDYLKKVDKDNLCSCINKQVVEEEDEEDADFYSSASSSDSNIEVPYAMDLNDTGCNACTCKDGENKLSKRCTPIEPECSCDRKSQKLMKKNFKLKSGVCPCKEEAEKIIKRTVCICDKCKQDREQYIDAEPCQCLEDYFARIKEHEQQKMVSDVQENLKCHQQTYVISGVTLGPHGNPVYMLTGTFEKPDLRNFIETAKKCKCREDIEKILRTALCQCDRCRADRRAAGLDKPSCACMEKYATKIDKYDYRRANYEAQMTLKSATQPYVISGVTKDREGQPVYILSNICPVRECMACVKRRDEQLKEQDRLANMPKVPPGRQQFVISGVRKTDQGNVYILSSAVPMEDCACMSVFNAYTEGHSPCLETYDLFLQKMEYDIAEYFAELEADPRYISEEVEEEEPEEEEPEEEEEEVVEDTPNLSQCVCGDRLKDIAEKPEDVTETPETQEPQPADATMKKQPRCSSCSADANSDFLPNIQANLTITLEINKDPEEEEKSKKKKVCICGPEDAPDRECIECECTKPTKRPDADVHRFILMDKIPCKACKQTKIVKQVLQTLAEDGYPLARLPDSHKLPIFKLWMNLRCGRYWTQDERKIFKEIDKRYWMHTFKCETRKPRMIDIGFTEPEGDRYTWANAPTVRNIAAKNIERFCRKVKASAIGNGREFFPTTFDYTFPTFRDCFFAYTPAKEAQCFAFRPWHVHEIKNFSKRRSCL